MGGDEVLSEPSSTSILYICKERRLCRVCVDSPEPSLIIDTISTVNATVIDTGHPVDLTFFLCIVESLFDFILVDIEHKNRSGDKLS